MAEITAQTRMVEVGDVSLHVDDYDGTGRPVVLIHGWPLSGKSWSEQVPALLDAGYHVITYDRRGFGDSDKPGGGYDYDTFAKDLQGVLNDLDVRDATIVGFSMGGGEVARYLGTYGDERIHSAVFASAIPPYLMKGDDNPNGPLEADSAKQMSDGLADDPEAFYPEFLKQFFSPNADGNVLVTDQQMQQALTLCEQADNQAALGAMQAFATTDFRDDLSKITVPTLVIHGDADGIVLFDGSGKLTHEQVAGSEMHVVSGGPHGINVSHADEFNKTLLAFLQK